VNNIQGAGATYKTSLMRTHVTAHGGHEDYNIEDIHCQIVMKVQRTKQILREIEGDSSEYGGAPPYSFEQGETNPSSKQGKNQNVIPVTEVEVLGSDFCSRKPVFLTSQLPVPRKQQQTQQQSQVLH